MATLIRMPEVLAGITEATIVTWLVEPGQSVTVGTLLAEMETEKAVVEYPSETEGTILRLLVDAGDTTAVGEPIMVIGAPGETWAGDAAASDDPAVPEPSGGASSATRTTKAGGTEGERDPEAQPVAEAPAAHERRFVTPLVRRLARERGIDLTEVPGSGPNGRIVRRDLDALGDAAPALAAPAPPATAAPDRTVDSATAPVTSTVGGVEAIPLTGMRRAIARRLTESASTVPHFYLVAECRVDALLAVRQEVNASQAVKVSLNDFVLKAAAGALGEVPEANATWGGDVIHRHRSVDIAVAVAVEGGLVTPVLRGVDRLSLTEVSRSVADLAERAKAGRLKQHELEGGSFSISNLGMFGVTEFTAIINPPHMGILAVGVARSQPVVEDGELAVGTVMTVTLSADHRVVDGALGARLLAAFQRRVEHPLVMLV